MLRAAYFTLQLLVWYCAIVPLSQAHDITCKDWISPPILTSSTDAATSGDDERGVVEACIERMPTINNRFKIKRVGDTPDTVSYTVTSQYCWARDFNGECRRCADWNWGAASCDSYGSRWGATDSYTFKTQDIGKTKGAGAWSVCLNNVGHGQTYLHGGTNDQDINRVCAYVTTALRNDNASAGCSAPWMFNWSKALVGCVDAVTFPGPPTYNKALVGTAGLVVDTETPIEDIAPDKPGYLSMGSSFEYPMVRLVQRNAGHTVIKELRLNYAFPGDPLPNNKINCGMFPMPGNTTVYCAKVPSDDPGKVCACEESKCDSDTFLGCVPRPTLQQSKLAVVPSYAESVTSDENSYPALSFLFVRTKPNGVKLIYDANKNLVDMGNDGQYYLYDESLRQLTTTAAVLPLSYTALALSISDGDAIKEYYLEKGQGQDKLEYLRDQGVVYGVTFRSIIPQFDSIGNMQTVYISLPGQQDCGIFSLITPTANDNYAPYIVPAGMRDASYCCPNDLSDKTACIIPPPTPCKDGATKPHDTTAVSAFCPGIYTGPQDLTKPDKICLLADPIWPIVKPDDNVCVPIPSHCWKVTQPNAQSGYATWSNEANANETQTGTCDSAYELTQRSLTSVTPKQNLDNLPADQKAAADAELKAMQPQLAAWQDQYNALNLNIPSALLQSGQYYSYTQSPQAPKRYCNPGTNAGTITNSCVRNDQCKAITQTSSLNGNAVWPDTTQATAPISASTTNVTITSAITGSCPAGWQQDSKAPQRNCITVFAPDNNTAQGNTSQGNTDNNSSTADTKPKFKMLYQYWDNPQNPCVKAQQ